MVSVLYYIVNFLEKVNYSICDEKLYVKYIKYNVFIGFYDVWIMYMICIYKNMKYIEIDFE